MRVSKVYERRAVSAIAPQVATSNTALVSSVIDLANATDATFYINLGTLADTDATFTVLVEDDDASGFGTGAAVADEFLVPLESAASFTFADDSKVRVIGYTGAKRYLRLTVTPANNTGNAPIGAICILGGLRVQPASINS
jgi:hypothetical protein